MQIIRRLILFSLVFSFKIHCQIWIPNLINETEGQLILDIPYPNPVEIGLDLGAASKAGFLPVQGDHGEFKRVLVLGKDQGFLLIENSKRDLKGDEILPGYFSLRHGATEEVLGQLPETNRIPMENRDFSTWKANDLLIVQKVGKLSINVSKREMGIVGILSSHWSVQIKKLPGAIIRLSFKRDKTQPYGLDMGTFEEKVNLFNLWGKSQVFIYEFELNNPQFLPSLKTIYYSKTGKIEKVYQKVNAALAFMEALKGNLLIADMLFLQRNLGVRKVFEEEIESQITAYNPLIPPPQWKFPLDNSNYPVFKSKANTFPGELLLENAAGINLFHEKFSDTSIRKLFVSYFQQFSPLDQIYPKKIRRLGASIQISMLKKEIETKNLIKEIQNLVAATGFSSSWLNPSIEIPVIRNAQVTVEFTLSNLAIEILTNLPEELPESLMINNANEDIKLYFQLFSNINQDICQKYGAVDLSRCIFTVKKYTYNGMLEVFKELRKINTLKNGEIYSNLVKSFSKMGRSILENRFILGTFLKFTYFKYDSSLPQGQRFTRPRDIFIGGNKFGIPLIIKVEIMGDQVTPFSKIYQSKGLP